MLFSVKKAFIYSVIYIIICFFWHILINKNFFNYPGQGWAITDFIADRWIIFVDFKFQIFTSGDLSPYVGNERMESYFPLSYIYFFIINQSYGFITKELITNYHVLIYIVFLYILLGLTLRLNLKKLNLEQSNFIFYFFFILISYPLLFLTLRGNVDHLLIILFLLFIANINNRIGVFFLIILCLFKPQFLIYLYIFFLEKKYIKIIKFIFIYILSFFLCLLILKGSAIEQLNGLYLALKKTESVYGFNNLHLRYSHSLNNLSKFFIYKFNLHEDNIKTHFIANFISILFLFFTLFQIFIKKISHEKRLILITILMLFIPYYSSDYKLLFLMIVHLKIHKQLNDITNWLLTLLYLPKHFIFYSISQFIHPQITISSFINPIIILIIIFIILFKNNNKKIISDEVKY